MSHKELIGPFFISNHCHPSVNPIRVKNLDISNASGSVSKLLKPPKPPDKPLLPYLRYSRKVWDSVKANHPDAKLWEIGKIIGQMWRELNEESKQEFFLEYETAKAQYTEQLKAYKNSPAYQRYIFEKNKVVNEETEESESSATPKPGRIIPDPVISLEPMDEDEDNEDHFSVKHLAAIRYERNHRLISEIFSDMCIPDNRNITTENRIKTLRTQVKALCGHQAKLEEELNSLEEKFNAKKKRLLESGEQFRKELEKFSQFRITEEDQKRMFDEQYKYLEKRWNDHVTKQNNKLACLTGIHEEENENEKASKVRKVVLASVIENEKSEPLMKLNAGREISSLEVNQFDNKRPDFMTVPESTEHLPLMNVSNQHRKRSARTSVVVNPPGNTSAGPFFQHPPNVPNAPGTALYQQKLPGNPMTVHHQHPQMNSQYIPQNRSMLLQQTPQFNQFNQFYQQYRPMGTGLQQQHPQFMMGMFQANDPPMMNTNPQHMMISGQQVIPRNPSHCPIPSAGPLMRSQVYPVGVMQNAGTNNLAHNVMIMQQGHSMQQPPPIFQQQPHYYSAYQQPQSYIQPNDTEHLQAVIDSVFYDQEMKKCLLSKWRLFHQQPPATVFIPGTDNDSASAADRPSDDERNDESSSSDAVPNESAADPTVSAG